MHHQSSKLILQISQRTIDAWGLPWTFRFLALVSLVLGVVSFDHSNAS